MNIRPATPTDLQHLISWIADKSACRMWAGPKISFPLEPARLSAEIEFRNENSFCLDDKGGMLAFGQLIPKQADSLHMARIVVKPKHRRHGYGHTLCSELIGIARERGVDNLSLNVYRNNKAALRLYTAIGFKEFKEKSSAEVCHMIRTSA